MESLKQLEDAIAAVKKELRDTQFKKDEAVNVIANYQSKKNSIEQEIKTLQAKKDGLDSQIKNEHKNKIDEIEKKSRDANALTAQLQVEMSKWKDMSAKAAYEISESKKARELADQERQSFSERRKELEAHLSKLDEVRGLLAAK